MSPDSNIFHIWGLQTWHGQGEWDISQEYWLSHMLSRLTNYVYSVFELQRIFCISAARWPIEMGFGSKCRIFKSTSNLCQKIKIEYYLHATHSLDRVTNFLLFSHHPDAYSLVQNSTPVSIHGSPRWSLAYFLSLIQELHCCKIYLRLKHMKMLTSKHGWHSFVGVQNRLDWLRRKWLFSSMVVSPGCFHKIGRAKSIPLQPLAIEFCWVSSRNTVSQTPLYTPWPTPSLLSTS